MTDLSTTLGPLRLKNPVMAASSEATMTEDGIRACLDAGAGAVVAKSVNESPAAARQLYIADYALLGDDGDPVEWQQRTGGETLLCRSGLASRDGWLEMLKRANNHARGLGAHVFGSITVADPEPAAEIAREMAEVVPAIELNVGAPHGREARAVKQITGPEMVAQYTRTVRDAVDVPLIVKLPAQADSPQALAAAARDAGADVVAMIGRFNGFWPDPLTSEPVLGSWGAVGGPGMLPVSLYWVSKTFAADRETPLIGTNGARSAADIARFLLSGARAVEVASAVLLNGPGVLGNLVTGLDEVLAAGGYTRAADAIGAAVDRARAYADIPPNPEPLRPWEET
ncbi:dihydroorotate dehydrogenase [Amycolatopsis acidicola]|uniref:dihydrouracil dehydrogenase (NAD(+)) n=1 Tax=Amycolatopsis acidicola TaxID=2596893 RepID=A0A5N0VFU2_9PSEU|nr:tRNA-dihydrouridine synthase [Amycolatopsis acidicola]KAA9163572.1 dihydroorotate dehydrogenase [Amycolatopsis acidicola]